MNLPLILFYRLKSAVLIFWGIILSSLCWGQSQLLGEWTNSYGSTLKITFQNQGTLRGIYMSSTGSTGKYAVIGSYTSTGSDKNVSVALTILWNSIDGSTKDPSQFWTSVMVGGYYSEKGTMELINQLTAAEVFAAVSVREPGIYPESLTFTRKQSTQPVTRSLSTFFKGNLATSGNKKLSFNTPLIENSLPSTIAGTWVNDEESSPCGTIQIVLKNDTLEANMVWNGETVKAIGLAAKPASAYQAFSMASAEIPKATGELAGITGLLNLTQDKLKIIISRARNVAEKNKYASTDINVFYFTRKKE